MATLSLSTLNTLKVTAFCVLTFFISGCGEKSQNTNVNTNTPPPLPLTELKNLDGKIKEMIKYEKFDEKNNCNIRTVDRRPYCANIKSILLSVEHGANFIYASESGVYLDERGEKEDCFVCHGGVKFFKFSLLEDNKLNLVNESEDFDCGPYGSVCDGITFQYGSGPEKGWIVQNTYLRREYIVTDTKIYLPLEGKTIEALQLQEVNESGAYQSDERRSEGADEYTKVKLVTIPNPSQKFFDLKGTLDRVKQINGKEIRVSKTVTIKFDEKKLKYDTEQFKKLQTE